jgi:uncharacterized protein (TIGR02453 family)
MTETATFSGFTPKAATFFRQLAKNNNKGWFEAHRTEYEADVLAPTRAFVLALGERLQKLAPGVIADPRANRSLFRINRDARFTTDKSPYKTHLGLWLWEGPRARMENSGFYFHLEPPEIYLGVGMYHFPDELLPAFRQDVVHPVHGAALADAVRALEKKGYEVGGQHYKRVPRGFDPQHPNAALLLYAGMYAGWGGKIPPEFYSAKLLDFCIRHYKAVLPLHQWLAAFVERQS